LLIELLCVCKVVVVICQEIGIRAQIDRVVGCCFQCLKRKEKKRTETERKEKEKKFKENQNKKNEKKRKIEKKRGKKNKRRKRMKKRHEDDT